MENFLKLSIPELKELSSFEREIINRYRKGESIFYDKDKNEVTDIYCLAIVSDPDLNLYLVEIRAIGDPQSLYTLKLLNNKIVFDRDLFCPSEYQLNVLDNIQNIADNFKVSNLEDAKLLYMIFPDKSIIKSNWESVYIKMKIGYTDPDRANYIISNNDMEIVALYMDWDNLFNKNINDLSPEFIDQFKSFINWSNLSYNRNLSEEVIDKYQNELDWNILSNIHNFSEEFIEDHSDKINWKSVCRHQILSEKFIESHINKIDWFFISYYQKLSEDFIRKYQDKVNWEAISYHQNLSTSFIKEFKDKINFEGICNNKDLEINKMEPEYVEHMINVQSHFIKI